MGLPAMRWPVAGLQPRGRPRRSPPTSSPGPSLLSELGPATSPTVWNVDLDLTRKSNSSALDRHLVSRTSGLNEVASCSIGVGAPSLGFDRLVGRQATSRPLDLCVGSAMTTGVHLGHWRRILPDVVEAAMPSRRHSSEVGDPVGGRKIPKKACLYSGWHNCRRRGPIGQEPIVVSPKLKS